MSETKREHKVSNKESKLESLIDVVLSKLSSLSTTIRTYISKTLKTLGDAIIARINQHNEIKQIENEAYKEELTELTTKRHDRAIELAKERGKQKAHGKKSKPKLTQEQLKTIETHRRQLGIIGKNLSSVVGMSMQQTKKKTKADLKEEIAQVKLEYELKELKRIQKHRGVQAGSNLMATNTKQNNALSNVLSFMGIQKKRNRK